MLTDGLRVKACRFGEDSADAGAVQSSERPLLHRCGYQ